MKAVSTVTDMRRTRILNPRQEWCRTCRAYRRQFYHITYKEVKLDTAGESITIYWDYVVGVCGDPVGEDHSH